MEIDMEGCLKTLKRGGSFAMATVTAKDGSAPRGPGAKMAVQEDGNISGTVGGGLLEALAVKEAVAAIGERGHKYVRFSLSKEQPGSTDIICGGSVEMLIEYVDGRDRHNIDVFETMLECARDNVDADLVTAVEMPDGRPFVSRAVACKGAVIAGAVAKWAKELLQKERCAGGCRILSGGEDRRLLVEAITARGCICIFGAGHVGLRVAQLASFIGKRTIVVDDREEFASKDRFPGAFQVLAIEGYRDLFSRISVDGDTSIVIVTRGHAFDRYVLEQSLSTDAGYIGMIGSRAKVRHILDSLLLSGFTKEQLKRVHSPIGLPINAQTPAEIAVSIIAEIIGDMRGRRGGS